MIGFEFDELGTNSFKESAIVYPPSKGETLKVLLLGDPVNIRATAEQQENGMQGGLFYKMWTGYMARTAVAAGKPFENSKGETVTPKSTPKLNAIPSLDENGRLIPNKKGSDKFLFEPHIDVGTFLNQNPEYWPSNYTSEFKTDWKKKDALALRCFIYTEDNKTLNPDEKVLLMDGAYVTQFVNILKTVGAFGFENFIGCEFLLKRDPDGTKTKASVMYIGKSNAVNLKTVEEHVSDLPLFGESEDAVFKNVDFDSQRLYLADRYGIIVPDSESIKNGTYKAK